MHSPALSTRPASPRWPWRAAFLAPLDALNAARGHLFAFVPVLLGLGVGAYFALSQEPSATGWLGAALACGLCAALGALGPERARPVAIAAALMAAGFLLAGWRAHSVAAPVLGWRYYGPVEGRIVAVDRSVSDALRLTLDQVVLHDVALGRLPTRVRVSLHGETLDVDPVPGTRIGLTGHLGPPGGPVEPGGFDFRRLAWFAGLGAVGYTRNPVLAIGPPEPGLALSIARLRLHISAGIRDRIPGEAGAFVAAILTGDRSGVELSTTEALRRSNLAHLLAISGLHMGLLTGTVFGALNAGLALLPTVALRWPIRKWAALGAMAAAIFYLALSGGNVATQRAFVMAVVMLGAVLFDRRVFSLRSVALAAALILIWRPEALLSAGFQMSFAATVALVVVFGWQRRRALAAAGRARVPRWRRAVVGVVMCSLVAGLATAPVAAAHFHRIAEYGLIANLLSVPLMGVLVMPAAVLAAVLWPIGLEGAGLVLLEAGARWIMAVAHWVSGFDNAVRMVAAPHAAVLPALALGTLWFMLWPGRARVAGLAVVAAAMAGWGLVERPALLISENGALVGVQTPDGRALTRARGNGFVARNWLEADGDDADQASAAARLIAADDGPAQFTFDGRTWLHLTGQRASELLNAHCGPGMVAVLNVTPRDPPPEGCQVIDADALSRSGARAAYRQGDTIRWRLAHDLSGDRPWTASR
ncbi:MAG: competence protein ComEC [Rhodobacteraceae bacterium HLUCCA12]|nr:MAG: competence protein ComEC [Rhodobacteraceae bacterium HLUCCA12]